MSTAENAYPWSDRVAVRPSQYQQSFADSSNNRIQKFGSIEPAGIPDDTPGFWLTSYPNPFRSTTTISFSLPEASHVTLEIYDVAGRLIVGLADEPRGAGVNNIPWDGRKTDGSPVPSGDYWSRLSAKGLTETQEKIVLIR